MAMGGNCIKHEGQHTDCKSLCRVVAFTCTQSGLCVNSSCVQAPVRNTPGMLATIPWATSPGIASQLAANSTLPNPALLYDVILNTELRAGPVGHHGFVIDPKQMGQKPTYVEWFNLQDDSVTHHSQLTIWLDTKRIWTKGSDVHMSNVRLPVAETVDFYEDHWEQTTPKGTFSGRVEPFPSPDQTQVGKLRLRTTPEILAHIPWTTSPWIDRQLAANSTLPNAWILYEAIINAELRAGPVGHSGVMGDPTQKSKYSIWWDLNDNPETHQSYLRIWLDKDGVWQSTQDIETSTARLLVAETVTFYEDHWEQTTAKGTFSGRVEPFPPPVQARVRPN